jgi:hypothetical protein
VDARYVGGSWMFRVLALGVLVWAGVWVVQQPEVTMDMLGEQSVQFMDELYSGRLLEGASPEDFLNRGRKIPTFEELQRLAQEEEQDTTTQKTAQATADVSAFEQEVKYDEEAEEDHDDDKESLREALLAELNAADDEEDEDEDASSPEDASPSEEDDE